MAFPQSTPARLSPISHPNPSRPRSHITWSHPSRPQTMAHHQINKQHQELHNHEEEEYIDVDSEESRSGGSWGSVGSTVLSRGWSIGKKAAIAGAALTSAPVLIPPLLVASAVGLAFAVPFGVFFTGLACTDKLMRSLLLPPAGPPAARWGGEADEGDAPVELEGEGEVASNLSSCYESAVEDFSSDAENKGLAAPVAGNDDVSYREEKIWEELSAIRIIVGYKTARRSSYIEELKALYVFTGVEPPLSVKDSSDIPEVNEKMQCLKAIVGIK